MNKPVAPAVRWSRVEANAQDTTYPWPVFETDIGDLDYELHYRNYGQLVIECASMHFDAEALERALWCGFSGHRILMDAGYNDRRTSTYAVSTHELLAASLPNPLGYAFRKGSKYLPTVAMFSPDGLERHDFGGDIIGKLYYFDEASVSMDSITQALFVFRDRAEEDALSQ